MTAGSGSYSTSTACGGVDGQLAVLGDHDRDRLALEDDLVVGDREALGHGVLFGDERRARPGWVPASSGLKSAAVSTATTPGMALAGVGVDARDARVGVRAAHDGHASACPGGPGLRCSGRRR